MKTFEYTSKHLCIGLLTILIFGWNSTRSQSAKWKFEEISIRQGLSQNTVNCILQDHLGFMWFGTRTGGLNRFDGYDFRHYYKDATEEGSISGNEIISLFEDKDHKIWVGTRNDGLNVFDYNTGLFKKYKNNPDVPGSLLNNTVNTIVQDENGKIWIGTNSGICVYDPDTDSFIELKDSWTGSGFPHTVSIIMDGKGIIYLGTKNGVFVLDGETKNTLRHFQPKEHDRSSIASINIQTMMLDSRGTLWIGMRKDGLSQLDDWETGVFINYKHTSDSRSLGSDIVRSIVEDENGDIWIGTKGGISVLKWFSIRTKSGEFQHFTNDPNDPKSLSQNSIYSIYRDVKGDLWIGTWSRGVNYLYTGDQKFEHYRHLANRESSLSNDFVSCFIEYNDDIWIGTEGGGINIFDHTERTFREIRKSDKPFSLKSDHIKTFFVDSDNDLWVGTYDGLFLYDQQTRRFTLYFKGRSIYSIEEGIGGELWVGCSNGLIRLHKATEEFEEYNHTSEKYTISNDHITIIFKDRSGLIWIGTHNGLNEYSRSSNSFRSFYYDEHDPGSISNNYVTSISEDKSGYLWIGTMDGLSKMESGKDHFVRYNRRSGLPDHSITNLIIDQSNDIWITTNQGLSKINESSLQEEVLSVQNYDPTDGLQDYEFIMNASFLSSDNLIFLGGINGFNVFDPSKMQSNPEPPEVLITNFQLFNHEVKIGEDKSPLKKHITESESITLNYWQSVMAFKFVAINYTATEKNQYAYMMEGFDEDWIYSEGRREAHYTNLPAGTYKFKVIGSNNDEVWNEQGASLEVIVLQPWWETWWFRLAVVLLISSIVAWMVISKRRKTKANERLLRSKIEEATREISSKNEVLAQEHNRLEEAVEETNRVINMVIESGDLSARIDSSSKSGTWKRLADSINALFDSFLKPFGQINHVIESLAHGDLTVKYTGDARGDIKKIADNINLAIDNLSQLIQEINKQADSLEGSTNEMMQSSQEINSSTSEISGAISEMSHGAHEQQTQIDQMSSFLESILHAASDTAHDAVTISDTADKGVKISENGMEQIKRLMETMASILSHSDQTTASISKLVEGSNKISKIINVINEIASQTNLLALNAAIEAAQAGDAGRGFSVVAEEIRKLAEDSKSSVREIEELVRDVQQNTSTTATAISMMGEYIESGNAASSESMSAFESIASHYKATFEKSQNMAQQIKQQTRDVEQVVALSRGVVVISEETSTGSEEIAASASQLASGMTNYSERAVAISNVAKDLFRNVEKFTVQSGVSKKLVEMKDYFTATKQEQVSEVLSVYARNIG